jgi:hypothetical protein
MCRSFQHIFWRLLGRFENFAISPYGHHKIQQSQQRIIELLSDLQTLTDLPIKDWTIKIENEEYSPNEEEIAQVIILNPNEYKVDKEEEEKLNEFRELAGISAKKVYTDDAYTKYIKSLAGM